LKLSIKKTSEKTQQKRPKKLKQNQQNKRPFPPKDTVHQNGLFATMFMNISE